MAENGSATPIETEVVAKGRAKRQHTGRSAQHGVARRKKKGDRRGRVGTRLKENQAFAPVLAHVYQQRWRHTQDANARALAFNEDGLRFVEATQGFPHQSIKALLRGLWLARHGA